MDVDDPHGFNRRFRQELGRLDASDLDDADKDAIRAFIREKDSECAVSTLHQYANLLRLTAERGPVGLVELTHDELKACYHDWRHNPEYGRGDSGVSEATLGSYQKVHRLFFDHLGREWAEDIDVGDTRGGEIDPSQMLTQDDISALITAADRLRDIALVEFLADTGARLGLTASLRAGDIKQDGDRMTYQPNPNAIGTKGAAIKPYPIIDARTAIRNYLSQTHPRPDDDSAPLFHQLREYQVGDGSLSPNQIAKRLKGLAADAGIDKPVNPHNFRHSAISRMWREGWDRGWIQHRVAWKVDTDMWEQYVHLAAEDINDDIFAATGSGENGEERPTPTRHPCGNCREPLAPHHRHCPNCGRPANAEGLALYETIQRVLSALLSEKTSAADREVLFRLLMEIQSDPSHTATVDPELLNHLDPSVASTD